MSTNLSVQSSTPTNTSGSNLLWSATRQALPKGVSPKKVVSTRLSALVFRPSLHPRTISNLACAQLRRFLADIQTEDPRCSLTEKGVRGFVVQCQVDIVSLR